MGGDLLEVITDGAQPALADRRHPRKGIACGPPGQPRHDQLPRRLRPAGPGADRDRPGRRSVGHAGRGRRGLRDRRVRRVRPARLAPAGHVRPSAAPAAGTDGSCGRWLPTAFTTPLGLHPDLQPTTFSVRTGDRLLFFTDGLLEARDRGGRFFRLDQQIQALRQPDLEAAADELLDGSAHTRRRLEDDIAVLLAELTLTDPGSSLPRQASSLL